MTMIFTKMSIDNLRLLQEKVDCLTVRFPKSDKLFVYEGCNLGWYRDKIPLYQKATGHLVETTLKELLVEMDYRTYQLHCLVDEDDYRLALELFKYYIDLENLSEEQDKFLYLLRLVIQDYESQRRVRCEQSTVDFIDNLLKSRSLDWTDLTKHLGYAETATSYIRHMFSTETFTPHELRQVSNFFQLPVQNFISGGYKHE